MTVGPPVDILIYREDDMAFKRHRRLSADSPDLKEIHTYWEQSLRKAITELPAIEFEEVDNELDG
jgi:putative proteasome-type protease